MNIMRAFRRLGLLILGALGFHTMVLSTESFAQEVKSALPPNYRQYVARAVAFNYTLKGKGPATIHEKPRLGGKDFCISYPIAKVGLLSEHPTETQPLNITVTIGRDIFGLRIFLMGGGQLFSAPCERPSRPFHELNKLAAEVRACRAKGGGACGVDAFTVTKVARELKRMR